MQEDNPKRYRLNGHDLFWHVEQGLLANLSSDKEKILAFSAIKYLVRYPYKNGVQDLDKAIDCLNQLRGFVDDTRTQDTK